MMADEAEVLVIWHLGSQYNVQKRTIPPFCEIELILGESVLIFLIDNDSTSWVIKE